MTDDQKIKCRNCEHLKSYAPKNGGIRYKFICDHKNQRYIYKYFVAHKISKMPAFICFGGGGKDGTAVLILAQMIKPDILVICADPPNPLPDRQEHIDNCTHSGIINNIIRVPYDWDVQAVLSGIIKYPDGLKMRLLHEQQKISNIDGIIWGCRNSESRTRQINFANNGYIYQVADGTYRCQPIAKWTPEEALALALATGYPINPVYAKMDGIYNLDDLHDGTWWPHGYDDTKQFWIKKYYPELVESAKHMNEFCDRSYFRDTMKTFFLKGG